MGKFDEKINLADGDEEAAAKIVHEIRKERSEYIESQEKRTRLPIEMVIGLSIVVLAVVLIFAIV